ncbi:hypothetical protein [Litchfieldia alkalitelluris]|uniref:hypothetical protein n=1 Tax=Litchfieldia alkalitelluris TaxID=304268 RepID=UPI0014736633|nr:hypothetical protein [Litchfieldia alkalitelluris]
MKLIGLNAVDDKVVDVLPIQDKRNITPSEWANSEQGKSRELNEIKQYANIMKEKIRH